MSLGEADDPSVGPVAGSSLGEADDPSVGEAAGLSLGEADDPSVGLVAGCWVCPAEGWSGCPPTGASVSSPSSRLTGRGSSVSTG